MWEWLHVAFWGKCILWFYGTHNFLWTVMRVVVESARHCHKKTPQKNMTEKPPCRKTLVYCNFNVCTDIVIEKAASDTPWRVSSNSQACHILHGSNNSLEGSAVIKANVKFMTFYTFRVQEVSISLFGDLNPKLRSWPLWPSFTDTLRD